MPSGLLADENALADFRSDSAPDCAPSTCSCGTRASRSNSPRSRRRLSRNLPPIRSSASASPSTKHHKTKQERPVVRRDFESQHLDKGYPAPSPNQTHRAYRRDRAGSARPYVHLRIAFRLSTGRLSRNLPPIRSSASASPSTKHHKTKQERPVVRRDFESQHLDKGYPAPSPNQTHRAYRRDRAGSARPYVHLRIAFRLSTGRLSRNLPPIRSSGSAFSSARYPEQKKARPDVETRLWVASAKRQAIASAD